jgi:hypothetical protein
MLIQRIALYFTLGLVLVTINVTAFSWQFWCILALFWASEYMTRKDTEMAAMAEGITRYLSMSAAEQAEIKKLHNEAMKEFDER